MSTLEFVTGRLTHLLRRYNRLVLRHSRVSLTLLPLATTLQFEGHPLRSLMTPQLTLDAADRRYAFDIWMSPHTEDGGDPDKDMPLAAGTQSANLLDFARNKGGKAPDFFESTVRLLYALGNTAGATMEITSNTLLVTHGDLTYGIKAGTTVSRFASGIEMGEGNPLEIVNRTETIEMEEPLFALLYREAYMRGKHLVHALTALRTGNPNFDFKRLVSDQYRRKVTAKRLQGWSTLIQKAPDPIASLYSKLVPTWMSRVDFDKHIARINSRKIDLFETERIQLMNKMYVYFNHQGKEQQ